MLAEFREDNIVRKVGGRFKLSTLVQKRMVALNRGAQALVDLPTRDLLEIVLAEVDQDKIYLDTTGRVQAVADNSETVDSLEALLTEDDGGPDLEDLVAE
jgi:DNA-directed RNA polymerase subunit omega